MSKSPFPGMDPYLEPSWRDVHHSLCTYASDEIQPQLDGGLVVRINERLVEPTGNEAGEQGSEGFIEIIDTRSSRQLITVIEFLSFTTQLPGPERERYVKKQAALAKAQVSFVEINLLRSMYPLSRLPIENLPPAARTDYQVIVRRGWDGNKLLIYPLPLRHRLSTFAVPLRRGDPVVTLDLQSLIDRVYKNGAYGVDIDYAKPLDPPLTGDDGPWAEQLLKNAALR